MWECGAHGWRSLRELWDGGSVRGDVPTWGLLLLLGLTDCGVRTPLGEGGARPWPLGTISPAHRLYIQQELAV